MCYTINVKEKETLKTRKGIKMKKYLIVRCVTLGDQYECDADRTPITMVEDWEKWAKETNVDYRFEVYELLPNGEFELIRHYEEAIEEGMALYYWEENEMPEEVAPHVIKKWPSYTRYDSIPNEVLHWQGNRYGFEGEPWDEKEERKNLSNFGTFTWEDGTWDSNKECFTESRYYVYGEYYDNQYLCGF